MSFQKQSLPQAVSERLQDAIRTQRWRTTLPGIRVLCDEMRVSRQTMMLALRQLEKDGYLHPAKPGKARAIRQEMISPGGPENPKESAHTVAVITHCALDDLTQTDVRICELLEKSLKAQGYIHRYIAFPYISRAMGAKRIAGVIEQNPADVYVVMSAHPQCSRALSRLDVPAVYIGGEKVKGATPRICYALEQMCGLAIEHLVSRGHRKISLLLPEVLNSTTKKQSVAEKVMEPFFSACNLPFTTYNCPRWGKTKADFNSALEKLFKVTPPTALILGDVNQVPRVVSFLMRRGLKYPDDVSLVVLDESHHLQEYEPPVSYLKPHNATLVRLTVNSVKKKLHSLPDEQLIVADTKLVITGSIAEPGHPE